MDIELQEPRTAKEFEQYYDLRWRILREPWTTDRESSTDEREDEAFHLGAWCGAKLAGVGRLHFNSPKEAQVRYMAVERGYDGRGIGSIVLQALEQRARVQGAARIVLNSRETALGFYLRHGYARTDQSGTLFDAIVHWRMQKQLL